MRDTFLVHLTRETGDGRTAKENLVDIICNRAIQARNSKGLFYSEAGVREHTRTVCFSETPLDLIRNKIGKQNGRDIQMSSYGLIFAKDFLLQRGANPVLYINTYDNDERKRLIIEAVKQLDPVRQRQIAPYLDIFGWTGENNKIYDFHWEHEWRYLGDFSFDWKDIIFGLCPDEYIDEMEGLFEREIRFISPQMSLQEIIGRLVIHREEDKYAKYSEHFGTT